MLTATDFFCGMGGSSTGLVEAGFDVKVAANHWGVAIETHSANHPTTEHLCADISNIDLRYLPRTDILWASPICTEVSPAGGTKAPSKQHDLFQEHGHIPAVAFDRTRVTFWEVVRAAEIHRYKYVLIENVVESSTRWELFDVWLTAMRTLGYNAQFISVSAAHVGDTTNPNAPQLRDRMYIAFNRHDMPAPDVDPRPTSWCPSCNQLVPGVQWWKQHHPHGPRGRRIGKYGAQYHYVCPECRTRVDPLVMPAAAAIDWTDLGERIGDRKRPLAAKTMARIRMGAELVRSGQVGFSMANGGRAKPIDLTSDPMRTWTTAESEAMALHPLVVAAAGNTWDAASGSGNQYLRAWSAAVSALPTQATTSQHGVATPPAFVTMLRNHGTSKPVSEPLATFTGGGFHHGLVIPFRKGAPPYLADSAPLSTVATRDQHGVLNPDGINLDGINLDDWHFRMLRPREAANAQRFPRDYVIVGTLTEQQMQAGNAVPVNVAGWLGRQTANAIDGRSAA